MGDTTDEKRARRWAGKLGWRLEKFRSRYLGGSAYWLTDADDEPHPDDPGTGMTLREVFNVLAAEDAAAELAALQARHRAKGSPFPGKPAEVIHHRGGGVSVLCGGGEEVALSRAALNQLVREGQG
jgi:hypothetical protein